MSTPNGNAPEPDPQGYPFEPAHPPVISEIPAQWLLDVLPTPAGERLALTFRVPNASVSFLLTREDALRFQAMLAEKVSRMHGLTLPGNGLIVPGR